MQIGFSTGALSESGLSLLDILSLYQKLNCNAVELNFARLNDLRRADFNDSKLKDCLQNFSRVSMHAPVKVYYGAKHSPTQEIFAKIEELNKIRPLDLVVFHPETVVNFEQFENLPFPVAFENMDDHKESYRNADDIKRIMAMSDNFRFALNVNHVFSNDPTMLLAEELNKVTSDRLSEVRLSGRSGHDEPLHKPLHETRQAQIIRAIPNLEIPIIIESVLLPETLETELQYIDKTIYWLQK